MTEKQLARRLAPWRLLRPGQRVVSLTYQRGQSGTVIERLGARLDGFAYYGVKMDSAPTNTTDFLRFELKPLRRHRRLVIVKGH
jgi:hypothetical protein